MTRIPFILLSTTDGSPLIGAAPSVTISKDGAAFTAATNTTAEIGNGYYYVDLTSAETTVTNNVIVRATATGAQPTAVVWEPEQDLSGLSTFDPSTDAVTINSTQAATLAAASDLDSVASKVELIKSKTDNLPASPAAVGSEMALTSTAIASVKDGLATISATDALAGGLDSLASYGDAHWTTAAGFATPSDVAAAVESIVAALPSDYAKATDVSSAQTALTALINSVLSGIFHWQVEGSILTIYNASNVAIGAYTLTKDSNGNITAVTPIVQQQDTNNEG